MLFILCLAGCGGEQRARLPGEATLLAFGDSLTKGKGVSEQHSYPTVLGNLCGCRVSSSGVSGETTTQGLARLPSVLEQTAPHLVILMHGGNDILRNHSAERTKQNLAAMIEMIQAHGAQVLLIGIPEKSLFSSSAAFYSELADQYNLLFDHEIVATLLRRPGMKSDAVHFNEAGYAAMANRIHEVLQDNGLVN